MPNLFATTSYTRCAGDVRGKNTRNSLKTCGQYSPETYGDSSHDSATNGKKHEKTHGYLLWF